MDIRELLGSSTPELVRWQFENMVYGGDVSWQIYCRRPWKSTEYQAVQLRVRGNNAVTKSIKCEAIEASVATN